MSDVDSNPLAPRDVEPVSYYAMLMCHGISIANELMFSKSLQRISMEVQRDPSNDKARELNDMFYGRSFEDVRHMYSASFRALMSESLQLSIRRKRDAIAEDLLSFASQRVFSLTINEKEIEFLVMHGMF